MSSAPMAARGRRPTPGRQPVAIDDDRAKSGKPRLTPLAYLRIDDKMLIVGAYAGADTDPAWVHNLRANPHVHIEVGTESFDVMARELPPVERDEVFPKITAAAPGVADYQAKTNRVIPLFELQQA